MALLGANQSIGEEEIFANSEVRKSKAVIKTSTVELFSVTAAIFLDCHKNQAKRDDSPDTYGAKDKWRKQFESQVLETNHITETKTTQFKIATQQHIEETTVPIEFAKKEERFSSIYGTKHVRSTSLTETGPQKLKPIPIFDDSIYQFNGIVVNPLIRRKEKTPRVGDKVGSPRMKNASPHIDFGHHIHKEAETPGKKPKAQTIRIQSALQRTKSSQSPLFLFNDTTSKTPKMKSIDNSPTSNGSPYSRSYLRSSSIVSLQNPIIQSLQHTHTGGGFFETVKLIALKENTIETRRTPETARGSISVIKSYKDDIDTIISSRVDFQLAKRKSSINTLTASSSQVTLGLKKLSLPIKTASSTTQKTTPLLKPKAPPKVDIRSIASLASTPMNRKTSQNVSIKSLVSMPSSPKGTTVLFSTRPQFKGNFLKRKL